MKKTHAGRSVHVVCSWCRAKIGSSQIHGSARESYGICELCLDGRLASLEALEVLLPVASTSVEPSLGLPLRGAR